MHFGADQLTTLFKKQVPHLVSENLNIPAGKRLVVSTDTLIEDIHFPINTPAYAVGHKALAVNLSDLAAMGAMPHACSLLLVLPEDSSQNQEWLEQFVQAWSKLAESFLMPLINIQLEQAQHSNPLEIHVTAYGLLSDEQGLYRSGAKPGDHIFVSGALGEAAVGLEIELNSDHLERKEDEACLVKKLQFPEPRIALGLALNGVASACLDLSDGLLADLGHINKRSNVSSVIHCNRIFISPALQRYCEAHNSASAFDFALIGGDDYELCFTVPQQQLESINHISKECDVQLTDVGEIVDLAKNSESERYQVSLVDENNNSYTVNRNSFEHFN